MSAVPIAVRPEGKRDYITDAVRDGGGDIVDLADARALIWTDEDAPDELSRLLSSHDNIEWVQLPWAGVEPYAEAGVFDLKRVWTSGKGVYAEPVAEHALALALAGLRELPRVAQEVTWTSDAGISRIMLQYRTPPARTDLEFVAREVMPRV